MVTEAVKRCFFDARYNSEGICLNQDMVLVARDAYLSEVPGLDTEFY